MEKNKTYQMVLYALFIAITAILGLTPLGFIPLVVSVTTTHMPVIIGGYSLGARGGAVLGATFGLTSLIRCFQTPVDITAQLMLGKSTGGFGIYNLFLIVAIIFLPRILCGVFSALTYKGIAKCKNLSKLGAVIIAAITGFIIGAASYLLLYLLENLLHFLHVIEKANAFSGYEHTLSAIIALSVIVAIIKYVKVSKFDNTKAAAMSFSAFIGSMTNTVFYLGGLMLFAFDSMAAAYGVTTYGALVKIILGVVALNGVVEAVAAVIICTAVGKAIDSARGKGYIR